MSSAKSFVKELEIREAKEPLPRSEETVTSEIVEERELNQMKIIEARKVGTLSGRFM